MDLLDSLNFVTSRTTPTTFRTVCSDCNQTFTSHDEYWEHSRYHIQHPYYFCDDCTDDAEFYSAEALGNHQGGHTVSGYVAKCPLCKTTFVSNHNLVQHLAGHFVWNFDRYERFLHNKTDNSISNTLHALFSPSPISDGYSIKIQFLLYSRKRHIHELFPPTVEKSLPITQEMSAKGKLYNFL